MGQKYALGVIHNLSRPKIGRKGLAKCLLQALIKSGLPIGREGSRKLEN